MARALLIDRRSFLKAAGISFTTALTGSQAYALSRTDGLYAAAFQKPDGSHGFALVGEDGTVLTEHRLTGRGHGFTTSVANGWSVAFARSPGNFGYAFRADSEAGPVAFSSLENRHFYGHGAFSPQGQILFATENDFENDVGIIGLYEAANGFRRIGEFPSGGIGPHEMLLTSDGKGLWVANGGIVTHPSTGKTKLNLDTMRSNICLIDLKDGSLRAQYATPSNWQRLSLRHMAIDNSGFVWIGSQHEGAETEPAPLVARCGMDDGLTFLDLPAPALGAMRNYVGSVAASDDGKRIAFTSPTGGTLLIVDAATGNISGREQIASVCGVAGRGAGFLKSTETGVMDARKYDELWDNHIFRIAGA